MPFSLAAVAAEVGRSTCRCVNAIDATGHVTPDTSPRCVSRRLLIGTQPPITAGPSTTAQTDETEAPSAAFLGRHGSMTSSENVAEVVRAERSRSKPSRWDDDRRHAEVRRNASRSSRSSGPPSVTSIASRVTARVAPSPTRDHLEQSATSLGLAARPLAK